MARILQMRNSPKFVVTGLVLGPLGLVRQSTALEAHTHCIDAAGMNILSNYNVVIQAGFKEKHG